MDNLFRPGPKQTVSISGNSALTSEHNHHPKVLSSTSLLAESNTIINRINNIYQPDHKFLDQLSNKSAMCLINEICRHHKIRADYTLRHTTGPDHAKVFTGKILFKAFELLLLLLLLLVSLQLGDTEMFTGEGSSIKSAQRNAATSALQNTRFTFPRVYKQRKATTSINNQANSSSTLSDYTPTSELNVLLMKRGIQPKYELTEKFLNEISFTNDTNNVSLCNTHYPQKSNAVCPQHHISYTFPLHSFQAPNIPSFKNNIYNKNHKNVEYPQMPFSSSINSSQFINSNFLFTLPYMNCFPNIQSLQTNQLVHLFQNKIPATTHLHSNFNYGYEPQFFDSYQTLKLNQSFNQCNTFSNNYALVSHNNKIKNSKFEAKVEFNEKQFFGQGRTSQAARHSAANEALNYLKDQPNNGKMLNDKFISLSTYNDQSPISLVYEIASKNRHKVVFELIGESGQAHVPYYKMQCSLYSVDSKNLFLSTIGEERSKKGAKKTAAQNMLKAMSEKSLYNTLNNVPSCSFQISKKTINQSKNCTTNLSSIDETNDNLCNNDLSISCSNVTLLYQLTRNLLIAAPTFYSSTLDNEDQFSTKYISFLSGQTSLISKVHRTECVIVFDQQLPQLLTCMVKSVGFGLNQRMAKSISSYICLLKIGIQPKSIGNESNEQVEKSLQFSLAQNENLPEQIKVLQNSHEIDSKILAKGLDFSLFAIDSENISILEHQKLSENIRLSIEQNLQFIIHILAKIYIFSVKDTSKPIEHIFSKLENSLNNFFLNRYPEFNKDIIQTKCNSLKELLNLLDGCKYWSHLQLLSSLVSIGIESKLLAFAKGPLLQFIPHSFSTETNQQKSNMVPRGTIISSFCSHILSHIFKFSLIKKNFISFGLGFKDDDAREVASLWILKKLSYLAKKHMIENEFEPMNKCPVISTILSESISYDKSLNELTIKKPRSKPSQGQINSKQCISLLYQICSDINIRKPNFESLIEHDTQFQSTEVIVECVLYFTQEGPEHLSTKMTICGLASNKRLARTICSYIILNQFGLPPSMYSNELFSLNHFKTYLQLSLRKNVSLSYLSDSQIIDIQPNVNQVSYEQYFKVNNKEIERNVEFLIHILQDVYRPFLKNHKMSNPANLMSRVESELFEYHNQQQQIMDDSGSFDRFSDLIQQSIRNFLQQFDGSHFWNHLQMLSAVVSLLTYNLINQIYNTNPPVFQFECRFCKSVPNFIDYSGVTGGKVNCSMVTSITVAIISIHSFATISEAGNVITAKPFLSFALSQEEHNAREIASYKALRHLAINLWK